MGNASVSKGPRLGACRLPWDLSTQPAWRSPRGIPQSSSSAFLFLLANSVLRLGLVGHLNSLADPAQFLALPCHLSSCRLHPTCFEQVSLTYASFPNRAVRSFSAVSHVDLRAG